MPLLRAPTVASRRERLPSTAGPPPILRMKTWFYLPVIATAFLLEGHVAQGSGAPAKEMVFAQLDSSGSATNRQRANNGLDARGFSPDQRTTSGRLEMGPGLDPGVDSTLDEAWRWIEARAPGRDLNPV